MKIVNERLRLSTAGGATCAQSLPGLQQMAVTKCVHSTYT